MQAPASNIDITHTLCNSLQYVIQTFGDQKTADLFRSFNTRPARRIPTSIWRSAQRKLKLLDAAAKLGDLLILSGNRLEALKGGRAGAFSIRVSAQYRITFRWEGGHAYEVRIEDYH